MSWLVRLCAAILVTVVHALPVGAEDAAPAGLVTNVALNSASVPQYGKLEVTFDVNATANNPFDPDEIAVAASVHTPSGKDVLVPGFYFQDFARGKEGAKEKLTPEGHGVWKVRYAPRERGRHTVCIEVDTAGRHYESAPLTFRCVDSPDRGFVRRAGNGRAFEFDDETPYFPVGMNLCWGRSTYDYDRWTDKLAANGCNWARLWIGPWDLFTLENTNNLGRYDMANAWRLDYVTGLAEHKGLYLMFCLESFNSLRVSQGSPYWDKCPYNAANGGPCYLPEEFFTNPEARRLFRQRLRYVVARWGYSTHVFAWELWNEVDIIEEYISEQAKPWHREMARHLMSLDPNRHLVSTSFANSAGDPAVDGLRGMSFVQTHNYGAPDTAAALNSYGIAKPGRYGKPHFIGEFGIEADAKGNAEDKTGVHLHEGLWAGTVSLAAATPMTWWWDNYIEPNNLFLMYRPLAKFVADIEWNKRDFRAAEVSFDFTAPQPPRGLDILISGKHNAWEDHPSNAPRTVTVRTDGSMEGAENLSSNLHGLKNHATWHNPVTFEVDSDHAWQFAVVVTSVSQYGGAELEVWIDNDLVLDGDFKEDPLQRKDALKCYNGEYVVTVPPGKHAVKIANTAIDWMVCHYKFFGYAQKTTPDVRAFGVQDDALALLWVQNETTAQPARRMNVKPTTVEHVALTIAGLHDGRYAVELWNTLTGDIQRQDADCNDGRLVLPLPPIVTDIAIKLRRQ